MSNQVAEVKSACPKCGVGHPYNPTYKIQGFCTDCRLYDHADRLLGGYRLKRVP